MLISILCFVIFHGVISEETFLCENGAFINKIALCDGKNDCSDGADENIKMCFRYVCPIDKFRCQYGGCIDKNVRCNGTVECADGSDEKYCKPTKKCSDSEFQCFNDGSCIAETKVCNHIVDCLDGSDETAEFCANFRCPKQTFRCQHGGCIREQLLCNGIPDCPDASDENPTICDSSKCKNGKNCSRNASAGCKGLDSKGVRATCTVDKVGHIPCSGRVPVGTVAQMECENYYSAVNSGNANNVNEFRCQPDGNWNGQVLKCEPDCGELPTVPQPLILHGRTMKNWPWHAVLYIREGNQWVASCGGTLIADNIVLTAAHCVWKKPVKYLKLAFSKYQANFDRIDETTQISDVQRIITRPEYIDVRSNYGSDIAVVFLSNPVKFTEHVRPACLDWNLSSTPYHLESGRMGRIAGMGLMENEKPSVTLQALDVPVVATDSCIKNQKRDFKKYVAYTTFCGGYANGTSVCNGDSGGGLLFPDIRNPNRWILQGVVSISPRRKDNSICDPNRYTLFTKVSLYLHWLAEIMNENEAVLSR